AFATEREASSRRLLRIRRAGGQLHFLRGQGREHSGQFHAKRRATFLPVVTMNPAAMFLHNAKANAETETCAFADGLGRIEGIENAVRFLDPRTGVQKEDD